MNKLDEKAMSFQEEKIPELAEGAFKRAYYQSLAAGNTVIEAINGELVETAPDGSRKVLKRLPKPIEIAPEQSKIRRRS